MRTSGDRRVLVTGGAGFLESHLCERLLAERHEVLCLDNYFTGTRANISHLLDNRNFETIRHDVTFPLYVEVDRIYNLACPASPIHYQHDPVQTHQNQRPRRHQHAGSCQAPRRPHPPGIDQRGLWQPLGPSPDRGVLGQRQFNRSTRLL